MQLIDGVVVLEKKNCTHCKYSDTPGMSKNPVKGECPKCHGTGRTKGGAGKGRCRYENKETHSHCFFGEIVLRYEIGLCPRCSGNYVDCEDENWTDNVPTEIFETIPWKVVRNTTRVQGFIESYIGLGLHSTTDYGAHHDLTDEELIAKEKGSTSTTQLCKLVRSKDDLTLCDSIVILTANQGYSVLGVFGEDEVVRG